MRFNELLEYFVENEENFDLNDESKRDECIEKIKKKLEDINSKEGRILKDNIDLIRLEDNSKELVEDNNELRLNYEKYKIIALRLLDAIPDDYDLKSNFIIKNIDYKNFDNEDNFKAFRYYIIKKIVTKEISNENNLSELNSQKINYLKRIKFEKYDVTYSPFNLEDTINKLNNLLNEIDEKVQERGLKEKYGDYSKFSLGRMYLLIIKKMFMLYEQNEYEFNHNHSKEKYDLLVKYLERDPNDDIYLKRNELGYLSFKINEKETYQKVCKLNRLNKKDGIMEYMLCNIENIFENKDNDKYIKDIIKRNFYFLPILIYINVFSFKKEDKDIIKEGSLDESIKMNNLFFDYVIELFNNPYEALVKDSMNNIEAYFNYYFEDHGATYSLFKILEKYSKNIMIEHSINDLESEYIKKYPSTTHEEFLNLFKNLLDIKLIKKFKETYFLFCIRETGLLKNLDSIKDNHFKDFYYDENTVENTQKA